MDIPWKTDKFRNAFVLHSFDAVGIPEKVVFFQIWDKSANFTTEKGKFNELFLYFKSKYKEQDGPYYFVYAFYNDNLKDVILDEIPKFEE